MAERPHGGEVAEPVEAAPQGEGAGLAIALAECCAATDDPRAMVGATVALAEGEPLAAALFGEAPTRVVITVALEHETEVYARALHAGVPVRALGMTGGDRLVMTRGEHAVVDVDLARLRDARERCLEPIVGT